MPGFSTAERARISAAIRAGEGSPPCPACGAALVLSPVARPQEVSYVRRRVVATCARCRRQAAVDVSEAGRP